MLVLDIMPPKLDGFELARRLRQQGRNVPILMLTARDTVSDIVRGLDLGADDYLAQPFALGEFFSRLRTAGRRSLAPAAGTSRLADYPWRVYGTVALPVAARITLYAGYTQGLEDSGIAPSNAENRGAILPAARTWQADAGLRYVLSPGVKVIAGVFDLNKPYFNLDTSNFDRQLASQRATGLELSLNGEMLKNLSVNVGAVFSQVRVIGAHLGAERIGGSAFGQPRNQIVADLDYSFPKWSAFSVDLGFAHFGSAPASVDGVVSEPAFTLINVGARYRSTLWGAPATLRVQALNVTNTYVWNVFQSPGFFQFLPRAFLAYLTVDV